MCSKYKNITTFFKYNAVAIIATAIDYLVFLVLFKMFGVWYVAATFISTIIGGIVAFILNRNWVFFGKDGKITTQAIKYLIVWAGSIFLNTFGLFLIVENTGLKGLTAKVITSVTVGIFYNYLMNNYYVFKTR